MLSISLSLSLTYIHQNGHIIASEYPRKETVQVQESWHWSSADYLLMEKHWSQELQLKIVPNQNKQTLEIRISDQATISLDQCIKSKKNLEICLPGSLSNLWVSWKRIIGKIKEERIYKQNTSIRHKKMTWKRRIICDQVQMQREHQVVTRKKILTEKGKIYLSTITYTSRNDQ